MYQELLEGLKLNSIIETNQSSTPIDSNPLNLELESEAKNKLFSIQQFQTDLINKSYDKNKYFANNTSRLNSYDIVHSCIRSVVFRMLGYPIESYRDSWLPVSFRTTLGSATHDFIQNTSTSFTELEVYLRIPSKNISVKIDCITGDHTIVEIKSCTYADYEKILSSNKPRHEDFYQALLYKILLENFLEESKQQDLGERAHKYNLPKLDKYNIKNIQMIYVCHEVLAADSTIEESIKFAKELRKKLKSKFNTLWFIKELTIPVNNNQFDSHINMIKDRLNETQSYIDNKILPPLSHKYIDKSKCFFCLYKGICGNYV